MAMKSALIELCATEFMTEFRKAEFEAKFCFAECSGVEFRSKFTAAKFCSEIKFSFAKFCKGSCSMEFCEVEFCIAETWAEFCIKFCAAKFSPAIEFRAVALG